MNRPAHPSRRRFLAMGAGSILGATAIPSWFQRLAFAQSAAAPTNPTMPAARPRVLVCVFQRGAADGLSLVVPHGEPEYYRLRPHLAIARPATGPDAAIDLDGHFGLHPRLVALEPFYRRGELAICQAVGSPDASRSHFDAQHIMEAGSTDITAVRDGLLNRCLPRNEVPAHAFRAVAMGSALPDALAGDAAALVIDDLRSFGLRAQRPDARDRLDRAFHSLYAGDDPVARAGRAGLDAADVVRRLDPANYQPGHAASYPRGPFGRHMMQLAQLIKADVGLEIGFVDIGGWDTHVQQGGAANGRLATALDEFGTGLAAFATDLGERMADVAVVTITEFGRTVAENGTNGTDHGHGSVMLALGGGVHGGRVLGRWPGLAADARFEGRDLAVTTDFRDVLVELVEHQLAARDLAAVFPGYELRTERRLGLFGR